MGVLFRTVPVCLACLCSGEFVLIGIISAHVIEAERLESPTRTLPAPNPFFQIVTQRDGQWYVKILLDGYDYDPDTDSSVAFFPLYPLLSRAVELATGWSGHAAAWSVALVCLIAGFGVFSSYLRASQTVPESGSRFKIRDPELTPSSLFAIAAFALYPPRFFLWMAYSESLFLLLCLLAMLGIKRGWRPWSIAAVIGAATATRPVGIALLAPLALYVWDRERKQHDSRAVCLTPRAQWRTLGRSLLRLAVLLPIACWGLWVFMAFQWYQFGTPFAFIQTQQHWSYRPTVDWQTRAVILLTGEPIWSALLPDSSGHSTRLKQGLSPHLIDPLYFVAAIVLVYVGAWKRWLNRYEVLLSVGLMLIPYVTKGYEMSMASQARFTTVVFPIYIVIGQIMARVPLWVALAFFMLCAMYLALYSALWAAGHILI